ncbi:MAG: tRNA lysidine(34) synthetase TilS, partial [Rhodothermales bacterium]
MSALVEKVRRFAEAQDLLDEHRMLVGISGGADSLSLADILLRLGHSVSAMHINFRLRGEASDADEEFVRLWCGSRGIPLVVRSFDTAIVAEERRLSIQEAARDLRYEAFAAEAEAAGVRTVAVGHHRDDQVETVLLNLFRGAGPEGLAGMPVQRMLTESVRVIRPLLCLMRTEVEAYAGERGLEWREDASNLKSFYRRGALRAEIIPLIEKHFGAGVRENIARSADLMREYVDRSLAPDIATAIEEAATAEGMGGRLHLDVLHRLNPVVRGRVVLEALRRWIPGAHASFQSVREVERLLEAQPGRHLQYAGGEVWRERDCLLFTPSENHGSGVETRFEIGDSVPVREGIVTAGRLEAVPEDLDAGSDVAFVDAAQLEMPLIVRRWRAGDRFSPLGMDHTKKLSDFLTDERVSPHEKAETNVVESGGRIVWVVGRR